MAKNIDARLQELGIALPEGNAPAANYLPYAVTGNLLYVSGQICKRDGKILISGRVGEDCTPEKGKEAARICALNVLAQAKAACGGDLNRIKRCVRLGVFVQSADDFHGQPQVANGASDVIVDIFGDAGRHVRAAVGCNALPSDTAVEIDAIFELED